MRSVMADICTASEYSDTQNLVEEHGMLERSGIVLKEMGPAGAESEK